MADVILPPKPGDPDRAEDLLDEIQGVLRKRNACMKVVDDHMVIAVVDGDQWRAIARVLLLAPGRMTWQPVRWR